MKKSLKIFAVLTTTGMIFVLLGGALVTKTDSGLGCGRSWPLCHGEFIPSNITPELIIELAHRMVSAIVGIMVLMLSVWAWKAIGHIRETKFLSILSVCFLVIQGLIGAAAVIWDQSDYILALHFGISLISFSAVFLLTLFIFEVDQKLHTEKLILDKQLKRNIIGMVIYSFIVIYTGALVRHTNASLACTDWPFCTNGIIQLPRSFYEWVHMGHRFAAGLLFLWIFYMFILAIKKYKHQKVIYWTFLSALILISLQVLSGAFVIFTRLNLYISLLHALFISCLFGVLSYLLLLTSRSKQHELALKQKQEQSPNDCLPSSSIPIQPS